MRFLHALGVLAALAGTAWADDEPSLTVSTPNKPSSTPKPTPSGPATIMITVGGPAGHAFDPKETTAKVGDIIRFNFQPTTHGVARAVYKYACVPFESSRSDKAGFFSGLHTVEVATSEPPFFEVRVNDTEPIFYYCAAPGSCKDYGMVGVINPNKTQTIGVQEAFAKNSTVQLAPGDPWPSEVPKPDGSSGSSGSSGDSNNNNGGGSHLGAGAIAGIVIGAAAVLIIGATLVYLCGRRGGFDKAYRKSVPPPAAAAAVPDPAASPMMVEAQYANSNGAGAGLGVPNGLKSPGQSTLLSFGGHDNSTLRGSVVGGYYPGHSPHLSTPSPGPQGGYGYHGHESYMGVSPQPTPIQEAYAPYVAPPQPAPVELPSGDVPPPTQSPPPGYQGRNSWVPGQGGHQP